MSSRKVRSVLAAAALAAGVSWLTAGPATARTCAQAEPALLAMSSIASLCDEHARLRLNDGTPGGGRMVTAESNKMAMAAGQLARQLGLTGLATGKTVLGSADLGGMAATWGMPSLTSASPALFPAVPGPADMRDVSTMVGIPALPALPQLPQAPLQAKVPAETSFGHGPRHDRVTGNGVKSALDLERPVNEVGSDVIGTLLPKAVESVEGTSMLPGGQLLVDGFSGMTQGLGLPRDLGLR
ncbi:hypothetical protein [Nonomuraea jiangxiensis]|uniref:Uncharacterized protein n=1 Tax=Nonomuraea jiangxiensis TaxID=633440 RepID=A0A1G9L401_9ACTN|nr:hypothetical protein [Nonomuraea jiangxiensis]SDL56719.1 hypothetical protein SAMN05421869_12787 [Nonomuraea jiangxiensis]